MAQLISIIIPIYNGAEYLAKCLSSLQNQTYSKLEFLLIDDGSVDASAEICHQFVQNDSRFIYLHKENGGVSSARNAGLKIARGDFVAFCDCDDWVETNYYEAMYSHLISEEGDAIVAGHVDSDGISPASIMMVNASELISDMYSGKSLGGYLWQMMFKREVLTNVWFDESISMCEDMLFSTAAFLQCKRILFFFSVGYHYIARETSLVHTLSSKRCRDAWIAGLKMYSLLPQQIKKIVVDNSLRFYLRWCWGDLHFATMNDSMDRKKFKMVRRGLVSFGKIDNYHSYSFKEKMQLFALTNSYLLTRILLRIGILRSKEEK